MHAPEIENIADELVDSGPMQQCRRAIASAFYENEGRLDIRHLWTKGDVSMFRVNWWTNTHAGAPRIYRSAFVAVEKTLEGLVLEDRTCRSAA
jgi:hypothetical protein